MKVKYEINPRYIDLKEKILELPERFEKEGEIIYAWRNLIKILELDGLEVNVKSFKIPHLVNRIVYAGLRKTKAERSYRNALRLLSMEIGTPEPIAYIVYQDCKGINRSFYISVQQKCDYVLRDLLEERPVDFNELFRAYVRFVYDFHQKGIYFVDLSTGNTLVTRGVDGKHLFYLVDLNRMTFHKNKLSDFEGMKNFCRIDLNACDLDFIIREYAILCEQAEDVLRQVLENRKKREALRRKTKHTLKAYKKKLFFLTCF